MKWVNRYKALIQQTSEGVIVINEDERVIDANRCALKMLGAQLTNVRKLSLFDLFGEQDPLLAQFFHGPNATAIEAKLQKSDKTKIEVEITAKRFPDGDTVIFIKDITQRKNIFKTLKYHTFLLENLKEAVVATDKDYKITMWNKAAESLYGWTEAEVLGKKPLDVIGTTFKSISKSEMYEVLVQKSKWVGEVIQLTKNAEEKNIMASVEWITNEQNEMIGSIAINIDITEKVKYENKLQQNYEQLKKIAWLQSHKVRAPLTNIMGIAEIIDIESDDKEVVRQLLGYLKTSAKELDMIVREITTLSSENSNFSDWKYNKLYQQYCTE